MNKIIVLFILLGVMLAFYGCTQTPTDTGVNEQTNTNSNSGNTNNEEQYVVWQDIPSPPDSFDEFKIDHVALFSTEGYIKYVPSEDKCYKVTKQEVPCPSKTEKFSKIVYNYERPKENSNINVVTVEFQPIEQLEGMCYLHGNKKEYNGKEICYSSAMKTGLVTAYNDKYMLGISVPNDKGLEFAESILSKIQ